MQLTQNMRNSRHISDFAQETALARKAAYSGTPAVLGPPVEFIVTMNGKACTVGLGKLITIILNYFYTYRQSPCMNIYTYYMYILYVQEDVTLQKKIF